MSVLSADFCQITYYGCGATGSNYDYTDNNYLKKIALRFLFINIISRYSIFLVCCFSSVHSLLGKQFLIVFYPCVQFELYVICHTINFSTD